MKMIEVVTHDYLRMRTKDTIVLRYDADDFILLPHKKLFCDDQTSETKTMVMIPRKVEMLNEDGSWSPYPSVVWVAGGREEYLIALFRHTDQYISCMCANEGFTEELRNMLRDALLASSGKDKKLYDAAERAGIHVETITRA